MKSPILPDNVLPLLTEGDPFLRRATLPYDTEGPWEEMHSIAEDLYRTMMYHGALGLSANQVGLPHRAFVMLCARDEIGFRVCFNPEIEPLTTEATQHDEGCLSFPGLVLKVKRPSTVFMRWTDDSGKLKTDTLTGYDAYCAQHELDHLNGVTFDQRVSKLALSMAKKKRAKSRK